MSDEVLAKQTEEALKVKKWPDAGAPHCDNLVLHAPGTCEYCDDWAEAQQERLAKGINFTGETDPNKAPCPSLARRDLATINRWGGNRPSPPR